MPTHTVTVTLTVYGHELLRSLLDEFHREAQAKVEKTRERWHAKNPGSTAARRRYADACATEKRVAEVVAALNNPVRDL